MRIPLLKRGPGGATGEGAPCTPAEAHESDVFPPECVGRREHQGIQIPMPSGSIDLHWKASLESLNAMYLGLERRLEGDMGLNEPLMVRGSHSSLSGDSSSVLLRLYTSTLS
jgi:hypothetical protein